MLLMDLLLLARTQQITAALPPQPSNPDFFLGLLVIPPLPLGPVSLGGDSCRLGQESFSIDVQGDGGSDASDIGSELPLLPRLRQNAFFVIHIDTYCN